MALNYLFQPIKIGELTLRNRVVMGSMHVGYEAEENGEYALSTFYANRAKAGGAGLIVTGGIAVSPEGEGSNDFLGFYRESDCKIMKGVTKAVHDVGGRIAAQMFHAGRYSKPELTGQESVAPSAIQSPIHRHVPRALSHEDILELVQSYKNSAIKAKEVGFDAVEVMGSEGYLLNQFLSPVTNQREDEWGGTFEKRVRLILEILKAIREGVGRDYPIIFRMSGDDLIPGSTTFEETKRMALILQEAGVDALNIGIGWHESQVPTISTMVPRAGFIHIAEKIKEIVSIPVIGSNRINDPQLADELLEQGKCDLVSMARPFLADPELLQKAARGEFNRINTCVACNQACLDHIFEGKQVSCLVNPLTGHEHKWRLETTKDKKMIAVIGGGVAGLEAARVLSEAGHRVTLYEAAEVLGGQLQLAKTIPGKEEFAETLRYYQFELERLNVDIKLNHRAEPKEIIEAAFDQVVVSVGVTPRIPSIQGVDLPHVYHYGEVLSGKAKIGKKVAIIGAGGIGCDVSHYLINRGITDITLMRRNGRIGDGLGKTTKWALLKHLQDNGVRFLTKLKYKKITNDGLWIEKTKDNQLSEYLIEADTIILASGQESSVWDVSPLEKQGIQVSLIGGARLAGELDAKRAIFEAARLAYRDDVILDYAQHN